MLLAVNSELTLTPNLVMSSSVSAQGLPYAVAGVGDLLALFRCISCKYTFSTTTEVPALLGAPGRVFATGEVRSVHRRRESPAIDHDYGQHVSVLASACTTSGVQLRDVGLDDASWHGYGAWTRLLKCLCLRSGLLAASAQC